MEMRRRFGFTLFKPALRIFALLYSTWEQHHYWVESWEHLTRLNSTLVIGRVGSSHSSPLIFFSSDSQQSLKVLAIHLEIEAKKAHRHRYLSQMTMEKSMSHGWPEDSLRASTTILGVEVASIARDIKTQGGL